MTEPTPSRPTPSPPAPPDESVRAERRLALNEDWAATVVGLVILVLVLAGVVPAWLVP